MSSREAASLPVGTRGSRWERGMGSDIGVKKKVGACELQSHEPVVSTFNPLLFLAALVAGEQRGAKLNEVTRLLGAVLRTLPSLSAAFQVYYPS